MSITSKGKRWEWFHSLWIVWTFTLGFFNWIAFFYIGIRAKQIKWILWGLFYSSTFIFAMFVVDTSDRDSWQNNLLTAMTLLLGAISMFHAFKVRKEYLIRLAYLKEKAPQDLEQLKKTIKAEIFSSFGQQRRKRSTSPLQKPVTEHVQQETLSASTVTTENTSASPVLVDINQDNEEKIAALPGIGIVLAKKVIQLRHTQPFQSVDDFGEKLGLKPHVLERVRPLVVVTMPQQQAQEQSFSGGRVIDY